MILEVLLIDRRGIKICSKIELLGVDCLKGSTWGLTLALSLVLRILVESLKEGLSSRRFGNLFSS